MYKSNYPPTTAAQRLLTTALGTVIDGMPLCAVTDPVDKAPISMYGLSFDTPLVYFASIKKDRDWVDLSTLASYNNISTILRPDDKRADNVCIRITDDAPIVCLDLEANCPRSIIAKAVGATEVLYASVSLSGKGAHVYLERSVIDELLAKYPTAATKHVWKAAPDDNGKAPYELLINNHCVTDTGIEIVPSSNTGSIVPLLEGLAAIQSETITKVDVDALDVTSVKGGTGLATVIAHRLAAWHSSAAGASEVDASYATRVARELANIHTDLNESEQVAVVTAATQALLEAADLYRAKWEEPHYSDGMTYGEGTALAAVSLVNSTTTDTRRFTHVMESEPDEADAMSACIALKSLGADDTAMADTIVPAISDTYTSITETDTDAIGRVLAVGIPTTTKPNGGRRRPRRTVAREVVNAVDAMHLDYSIAADVAQSVVESYGIAGWSISDTKACIRSNAAERCELAYTEEV